MKSYLPLLTLALIITSCSSVYKSGQTPDDVYFSPDRPVDEYVRVEKKNDQRYISEDQIREDRYLRMNLYDRRWSSVLDDEMYYSYNPYNRYYNSFVSFNSPWNYYDYWNLYYNPYCGNRGYYSPKIFYTGGIAYTPPAYNKPRTTNLFVFSQPGNYDSYSNNPKGYRPTSSNNTNSGSYDNYRNTGTNAGNFLRNVFNSGSSSNTNSGSSNSGNSGSSSGSSSSGSSSSSRGHATRGN